MKYVKRMTVHPYTVNIIVVVPYHLDLGTNPYTTHTHTLTHSLIHRIAHGNLLFMLYLNVGYRMQFT